MHIVRYVSRKGSHIFQIVSRFSLLPHNGRFRSWATCSGRLVMKKKPTKGRKAVQRGGGSGVHVVSNDATRNNPERKVAAERRSKLSQAIGTAAGTVRRLELVLLLLLQLARQKVVRDSSADTFQSDVFNRASSRRLRRRPISHARGRRHALRSAATLGRCQQTHRVSTQPPRRSRKVNEGGAASVRHYGYRFLMCRVEASLLRICREVGVSLPIQGFLHAALSISFGAPIRSVPFAEAMNTASLIFFPE